MSVKSKIKTLFTRIITFTLALTMTLTPLSTMNQYQLKNDITTTKTWCLFILKNSHGNKLVRDEIIKIMELERVGEGRNSFQNNFKWLPSNFKWDGGDFFG